MVENKTLIAFMTKKLGGEKALMKEYVKERLMSSVSGGVTFGELIEIAKKEDWLPTLLNLPISSLSGGVEAKEAPVSSGRITQTQKDHLQVNILSFLKAHPKSSKGAIAKGVNYEASKVVVQLRALKSSGSVESTGSKVNMVYSLKG